MVLYPAFDNLKRETVWLEKSAGVVGSLTSYYENAVDTQGTTAIQPLPNAMAGPLDMFPQLDVMPGAASAFNQSGAMDFSLKTGPGKNIDTPKLMYEEALGNLMGYRMNNDVEFKDEAVSSTKFTEGLFKLSNENIELHAGQAPFGMHAISTEIAAAAKQVAIQHAMGDAQEARDAGLERGHNPAINGSEGEQAFHNTNDIPANSGVTESMDIDAIPINNEEVHVEDTMYALDGNVL